MKTHVRAFVFMALAFVAMTALYATDLTKAYEMPDAGKLVQDDLIPKATQFALPKECKLDDPETIARGKFLYHNLSSKVAKDPLPKGLQTPKEGEVKSYGNCVACHNIEGAIGGGNVGPDLTNYKAIFVDTKVRDAQFVYQKIADPRVDMPHTSMTINLTTKMFSPSEVCDVTAYVLQDKSKK